MDQNKRRFFTSTLILFFFFVMGNAQESRKYSNEYLAIGVGARAHGMGKAVVANVNNGEAGYWNPAGLVGLDVPFQVNFMHAEWFAGIAKFDYLSIAVPLGKEKKSAFGLSVVRFGTDDIPNTLGGLIGADGSVNYDAITAFSAADYAIMTSYARKIKDTGFQIGGTTKLIYRSAGRFASAWGFGLDLGVQYRMDNWSFALMGRDITSTFNAWKFNFTDDEQVILGFNEESSVEITRPRFILGTAYETRVGKDDMIGILGEIDLDFTTDGQRNVLLSSNAFNMDMNIGVELDYKDFVYFRTGLNNFQRIKKEDNPSSTFLTVQPNLGLGIKISAFQIDYALSNVGNVSEALYSHVISLGINFKQKKRTKSSLDVTPEEPKKKKDKSSDFPDHIEQID